MPKKAITLGIILILVILSAVFFSIFPFRAEEKFPPLPSVQDPIQLNNLKNASTISSPLTITGKALGGWYFEASFPVNLLDSRGVVIAQAPAQAQSDWMTPDFVPFSVTLIFEQPQTATGTLVFRKDNPSGDPARDESFSIPVVFAQYDIIN